MVVANKFSEPFNVMPSDGPLQSFPSYLNLKLKESFGPHESSFWRRLYQHIDNPKAHGEDRSGRDSNLSTTRGEDKFYFRYETDFSANKDIQNLSLLAREQEQRIVLLEQQLRDERLAHELEIQRLHHAHRAEILKQTQTALNEPQRVSAFEEASFLSTKNRDYRLYDGTEFCKSDFDDEQELSIGNFTLTMTDGPTLLNDGAAHSHSSTASRSRGGGRKYDDSSNSKSGQEKDEEEDFLLYIERFQKVLKHIDADDIAD